ncbi:MAG: bifunctional methylenetetrahydrofolate dehydrogenase/methenyltetrahydrofolate cyclohydrolase FolD [Thermaerobacter sp.]|nr:bifunctional methylenetetrahydrofolate dehydrogenase/methenyltetrahydrofolate cyclohydrolase FolD [Bacillota bacterium]REJ34615.1 MAG: bifunctional methylenetetrahydrofolate dehydrogenase/methenyltetrahydrofolate cyclohydrolase FolD [Bacillota bacterium]
MAAQILDGRALADRVRQEVAARVADFRSSTGITPGLAVVLVGDDPASQVYIRAKMRECERAGLRAELHHLPADARQDAVEAKLRELNSDPDVHGILLQWPVPSGLDYGQLIEAIAPIKDVDGFHPVNAGRLLEGRPRFVPCTPLGILRLLEAYDIPVAGRHAVVVGRSPIVGRPMAALLLAHDATVTICHSKTPDLASFTRQADVLVVAVGRPGLIGPQHVKPGAAVIDVGINRLPGGRLVGDVDFEAVRDVAGWITPVPGGVGPMTVAMLLHNTCEAARWITQGSSPSTNSPGM